MVSLAWLSMLALATACREPPRAGDRLRIGFFPTVTHAAALVLLERPELRALLAGVTVEPRPFNAGPEAMEALFAGAIDACYVGAMPAINGFLRSRGEALRIVAGAASGGAAFVVRKDAGITGPESLHGKKLATPQLGNSQDVAMRAWLAEHHLRSNDLGGDVYVLPMANADILSLMKRKKLDGAWVVEPWVARLTHEADGRVFVDEKDLWPGGEYPTAVLVITQRLERDHPELVKKLVGAHLAVVRWIGAHPDEAEQIVGNALYKYAHKKLPPPVLTDAFHRVHVTAGISIEALERVASWGRTLDYLPKSGDPRGALDLELVEALTDGGQDRGD